MPEGSPNEIGRISVGIEADTTQLTAGLASAEQQTQRAAASMSGSWGRLTGAVATAANGFRAAVRTISGVIGTFTRFLGIIGLVTTAIAALYRLFDRTRAEMERMQKAMEARAGYQTMLRAIREVGTEISDLEKQMRSLLEKRAEVFAFIAKAVEQGIISPQEAAKVTSEVVRAVREAEERLAQRAAEDIAEETRARLIEALATVQDFEAELAQDLMTEDERRRERLEQMLDLLREVRELGDPAMVREAERLRQRIVHLDEERRRREAAEREAEARREAEEMAAAIRRAIEDGMREAVRDMIQQWRGVAGAHTIVGELRSVAAKLDLIRGQMPRGPFTH